jgi:hypothetical protein
LAVGAAVGDVVEDASFLGAEGGVAGVVGLPPRRIRSSTAAAAVGSGSEPPAARVRIAPTRSMPLTCLSRYPEAPA